MARRPIFKVFEVLFAALPKRRLLAIAFLFLLPSCVHLEIGFAAFMVSAFLFFAGGPLLVFCVPLLLYRVIGGLTLAAELARLTWLGVSLSLPVVVSLSAHHVHVRVAKLIADREMQRVQPFVSAPEQAAELSFADPFPFVLLNDPITLTLAPGRVVEMRYSIDSSTYYTYDFGRQRWEQHD